MTITIELFCHAPTDISIRDFLALAETVNQRTKIIMILVRAGDIEGYVATPTRLTLVEHTVADRAADISTEILKCLPSKLYEPLKMLNGRGFEAEIVITLRHDESSSLHLNQEALSTLHYCAQKVTILYERTK